MGFCVTDLETCISFISTYLVVKVPLSGSYLIDLDILMFSKSENSLQPFLPVCISGDVLADLSCQFLLLLADKIK